MEGKDTPDAAAVSGAVPECRQGHMAAQAEYSIKERYKMDRKRSGCHFESGTRCSLETTS